MIPNLREIIRRFWDKSNSAWKIYRSDGIRHVVYAASVEVGSKGIQRYIEDNHWCFRREGSTYKMNLVYVDPDEIIFEGEFSFPYRGEYCVVGRGGGNWDMNRRKFSETIWHRSLVARFESGQQWEDTEIWDVLINRIAEGKEWRGCSSPSEIIIKLREFDKLFQAIRDNGYQPQSEHATDAGSTWKIRGTPVPDEIRIAIDRTGNLIRCSEGRHRLSIAKILEIDSIPVLIQIEHANCERPFIPQGSYPIKL